MRFTENTQREIHFLKARLLEDKDLYESELLRGLPGFHLTKLVARALNDIRLKLKFIDEFVGLSKNYKSAYKQPAWPHTESWLDAERLVIASWLDLYLDHPDCPIEAPMTEEELAAR